MLIEEVVTRLRRAGCVFAEEEARLVLAASNDAEQLEHLVARRVAGEPLEHLLGRVEFAGLSLAVGPGVFVPRQRTAVLAGRAAALAAAYDQAVVVDLCCGCGAIGAVVADRVPGVRLVAADLDPVAVALARRNLEPYAALVVQGDLFAPLPRDLLGAVDVLAVNAPYVPSAEVASLPPEARDHEPRTALDGGVDGLDVHRRVLGDVRRWLAPGGHLLIETSTDQAEPARQQLAAAGLRAWVEHDDDRGATVVLGRAG